MSRPSDAPPRLRDDAAASAELRDDLRREIEAAVPYDTERGMARFLAALPLSGAAPHDAGSLGGASGGANAASSIGAGSATSLLHWMWWGLSAVGVAGVAAVWVASERAPAPATALSLPSPSAMIATPTPNVAGSSVVSAPATEADPVAAPTAVVPDSHAVAASAPAAGSPSKGVATSPSTDSKRASAEVAMPAIDSTGHAPSTPEAAALLREEVDSLARLRAEAASNPAHALALAEEGHRRFAAGVLYQEREAIAIGALARMGRSSEAKARATSFVTRYPRSPLADRVRRDAGLDAVP